MAHAILVFQLPFQNVREDLKVAMTVRPEALTRRNPVFIYDAQCSILIIARVVVTCKAEAVVGL